MPRRRGRPPRGTDDGALPRPVHLTSGSAHLGYVPGSLPVTEAVAEEVLSLPLYPSLKDSDQEQIITAAHESLDAV